MLHLHHVGITVQDLRASIDWYRKHLGFEVDYDFGMPGVKFVMLVRGNARLELIQSESYNPPAADLKDGDKLVTVGGTNHLALAMEDLQAAVDELTAAGVEIAIPPAKVPNDTGHWFAFIRDNERMLIELFQPAT